MTMWTAFLHILFVVVTFSPMIHCFSVAMRGRQLLSTHIDLMGRRRPSSSFFQHSSHSSLNMVRADGSDSQLSSSLTSLMKPSSEGTQFVFVGGKGGVGKTSSSSAIAIALSDAGLRTLIVSTDPAHSLGDALDVNLRSGNVVPITTEVNLWALEIDVDAGKRRMHCAI